VKQKIIIFAIALLITAPVVIGIGQTTNIISELDKRPIGEIIYISFGLKYGDDYKPPCSKITAKIYIRLFRGTAVDMQWLNESQGLVHILDRHEVPSKERYRLASFFIKKGLEVNAKFGYDETALHRAIEMNSKEDVAFLLSKGANIDIETERPLASNDFGEDGYTQIRRGAIEYAKALSKLYDQKDRVAIIKLLENHKENKGPIGTYHEDHNQGLLGFNDIIYTHSSLLRHSMVTYQKGILKKNTYIFMDVPSRLVIGS